MRIRYLKLKNWLIVSLMGAFGLSACHCNKNISKSDGDKAAKEPVGIDDRRYVAMYGVPSRDMKKENVDPETPKNEVQPREPQVTVYGVPTMDYAVKGRVVDANGKPVKDVVVSLVNANINADDVAQNQYLQEMLQRSSDTTDSQGVFEVRTTDRPWEKVHVVVRDVDGSKNGKFENQNVEVEFGEPESTGDTNKWNQGVRKAEVTVKMKRKK